MRGRWWVTYPATLARKTSEIVLYDTLYVTCIEVNCSSNKEMVSKSNPQLIPHPQSRVKRLHSLQSPSRLHKPNNSSAPAHPRPLQDNVELTHTDQGCHGECNGPLGKLPAPARARLAVAGAVAVVNAAGGGRVLGRRILHLALSWLVKVHCCIIVQDAEFRSWQVVFLGFAARREGG